MTTLKNLDGIHASARANVEAYVLRLISTLGAAVRSVAIYGSATGPDYLPKKSNVNVVVVVDTLTHEMLAGLVHTVEIGKKQRIVPPLLVTPDYIKTSLDVFPMEFLEIKDTEVVVYGEDAFQGLEISRANLRLECESQLKGAMLRTRQAYLELGGRKRGAEQVLHASLTALVPVFRTMLRLKGAEPPRGKAETIRALGEAFGVETSIFMAVLRDKSGDEKISGADSLQVLGKYVDYIEVLAEKLDQMRE